MNRLRYRLRTWWIARQSRLACRRADFVIHAVRNGMPIQTAVARSKALLFVGKDY